MGLGQDNIEMYAALNFIAFYDEVVDLVANLALVLNVVSIIAITSMLKVTQTLLGISDILFSVGMVYYRRGDRH